MPEQNDKVSQERSAALRELEAELREYADLVRDSVPFSVGLPTFERWAEAVREAAAALSPPIGNIQILDKSDSAASLSPQPIEKGEGQV